MKSGNAGVGRLSRSMSIPIPSHIVIAKIIRPSVGTVEVDRDNPGFTITVEDER